ncbi:competence type IV pilus assembly protein ComGB [Mammaliicoccus stepanovicii]|uniref:Type II secretion system protein PulF n=2 Tax=Mammaliicoccus stepanovicii TaxID=643214 RepID=A0A239Z7E6_9STAP|nr:competence type IV pilus assembly protein ComGB [Mammaliicoccus stepanovicii]PNZ72784.1 hypothetical protein CD111_10705 [Mammaliicoccus stepanovicii]GGI40002.1 competence protein ComG [Mammaliicoccus stepanovicii]SNV66626.1 type II secretion system protein PulF [Mammaliicoccus stepanovicii]
MTKKCILKKDKILYLTRLSDMLKQGFTLLESIQLLSDQFPQLEKRNLNQQLIEMVKTTGQLYEILSLLKYPQIVVTQIYFGEHYGNLIETLDHSTLYLHKIEQVKARFIKTIQYPGLLFCIFFMLLVAVNQTIIPQFSEIYESMNVETTNTLKVLTIIFSNLPNAIILGVLLISLIILIFYLNYLSKDVSKKITYFNKFPLLNAYFRMFRSYQLSRDFSFFIKNGINLHKIIEIYMLQNKDVLLKYIGLFINNSIQSGQSFPDAIKKLGCFEDTLIYYIRHGENKSKLDLELYYFSIFILDKLERTILKHLKWIQPIVFGTLAFLIITLYLIIILPMLQMVESIK